MRLISKLVKVAITALSAVVVCACSFMVDLPRAALSQTAEPSAVAQPVKVADLKVLVFSKTAGFRHKSIAAGKAAIKQLGQSHGFRVTVSENADLFTDEQLKPFNSIVFLNTTGDILTAQQQTAFTRYLQAGGGFVGIHAATDTEHDWPWYGKLVGAYFKSHPKPQTTTLLVDDNSHPSTVHLSDQWQRFDEWYNFKTLNPKVSVLLSLDESSYQGGNNGKHHPIAWYHEYDGGRAFYTGGGHTKSSYAEPEFLQHLLGGILYSVGYRAGHSAGADLLAKQLTDKRTLEK